MVLDLNELVLDAVAESNAAGGQVRINPAENLPLVRADVRQTRHLLRVLLLFFGKASRSGEAVTVSTRATPTEVLLDVSAQSDDVERADTESLFEPFRSRHPAGSGLGLASVKKIADAHGARTEVHFRPGGASLAVAFPNAV